MKITKEHYKILSDAIQEVRKEIPELNLDYYIKNNLGKDHAKRFRWDCLWAAKKFKKLPDNFVVDILYEYCDNTHIDTALRKIVHVN